MIISDARSSDKEETNRKRNIRSFDGEKDDMSLLTNLNMLDEIVTELITAVHKGNKVHHLLLTLPSSYHGVITAVESLLIDNLSVTFVKTRF